MGYMSPEQVSRQSRPTKPERHLFVRGDPLRDAVGSASIRGDTRGRHDHGDPDEGVRRTLTQTNKDRPSGSRADRAALPREESRGALRDRASDVAFDLEALSGLSRPPRVVAAVEGDRPWRRSSWSLLAATAVGSAAFAGAARLFGAERRRASSTRRRFARSLSAAGRSGGHSSLPMDRRSCTRPPGRESPSRSSSTGPRVPNRVRSAWRTRRCWRSRRRERWPFHSTGRQIGPLHPRSAVSRESASPAALPRDILDDVAMGGLEPGRPRPRHHPRGRCQDSPRLPDRQAALRDERLDQSSSRVAPRAIWSRSSTTRVLRDDGGFIAVVDRSGKKRTLSPFYATAQGLAWRPDGSEIWYTAAEGGFNRAVHALTLSGKARLVGRVPGISTVRDISKDGRVLMTNESSRLGILSRKQGEEKERELSWLDFSLITDISPDGNFITLTESGEGGGANYSALHPQDRRDRRGPTGRGHGRSALARWGVDDLDRSSGRRSSARPPPDERGRATRSFRRRASLRRMRTGFPTGSESSFPRRSRGAACGSTFATSPAASRVP
jgi:hypothetical protein